MNEYGKLRVYMVVLINDKAKQVTIYTERGITLSNAEIVTDKIKKENEGAFIQAEWQAEAIYIS